ncbi:hypothetical protein ACFY2W_15900 [Streptomyces sp. NPDC001262]|uniref:hypothetical protein n=1 Tax=Streptomyces TaxID=1883 RepID=UPI0036B76F94
MSGGTPAEIVGGVGQTFGFQLDKSQIGHLISIGEITESLSVEKTQVQTGDGKSDWVLVTTDQQPGSVQVVIVANDKNISEVDKWWEECRTGQPGRYRNVTLERQGQDGKVVGRTNLINAVLGSRSKSGMSAGQNNMTTLTLEIHFTRVEEKK